MELCQKAERLGVALKVLQVGDDLVPGQADLPAGILVHVEQFAQVVFKPGVKDHLPKMPEGRVADIVKQPGAGNHIGGGLGVFGSKGVFLLQCGGNPGIAFADHSHQLFAQDGNLQRVGESCADKIAFVQGKYLRFVLEPPKGRAVDDAPIVGFKFAHSVHLPVIWNLNVPAETEIAEQLRPVHPCTSSLNASFRRWNPSVSAGGRRPPDF